MRPKTRSPITKSRFVPEYRVLSGTTSQQPLASPGRCVQRRPPFEIPSWGKSSGQLQFCLSLSAPLQTQSISDGQGRRRIENDNVASILDASYRIVEPFEEQPEIVTVFCTRQEGMSNSRSMSSRLPGTRSTSGNTSSGSHPPANVAPYRTGSQHRPFHSLRDRIPAGCCTRPSSTLAGPSRCKGRDSPKSRENGPGGWKSSFGSCHLEIRRRDCLQLLARATTGQRVWASLGLKRREKCTQLSHLLNGIYA